MWVCEDKAVSRNVLVYFPLLSLSLSEQLK